MGTCNPDFVGLIEPLGCKGVRVDRDNALLKTINAAREKTTATIVSI